MSVYKRKFKDKKHCSWRAVVRIKGHPSVCKSFERKEEADDWAADIERKIKLGQFKFDQHKMQHTYNEVIERVLNDGALEHHRSVDDTKRHLDYWQERLGKYALVHLTPEFIGKERQLLLDSPSSQGKKRSTATVNRYMASLSSSLNYAVKQLRWIDESPCAHLIKLKENPGRDRVLTKEELEALLSACRQSRSPYLYCTVLISLTTGARQGEILNLEWKHIDFDNKLACLKETKNGRPRSITLVPPAIEELQRLYSLRQKGKPLVFARAVLHSVVSTSRKPGKKLYGRLGLKIAARMT